MEPSAQEFIDQVPGFIAARVEEANQLGLPLAAYTFDHVCLRVVTPAQYSRYKQELGQLGELLSEALINGRPICTFKLRNPPEVLGKSVPCLELPSPKAGSDYPLGLEHFECVIEEPLTRFIQRYPALKFNVQEIKNPLNAAIGLKLPSGFTIKFHNQSLETIIAIEKRLGL